MRLDQFLRYSRLVKRRPLAKSLADGGAVDIEGKTAKASAQVEIGDVLRLRLENKTLRIRVLGEANAICRKKTPPPCSRFLRNPLTPSMRKRVSRARRWIF